MDELWTAYLADRSLKNRDALLLALLPLVERNVQESWVFQRGLVRSEASMQILESLVDATSPISVADLGIWTRSRLYAATRQADQEQERLRELTERFGDDTSEWPKHGRWR